MALNPKDPNPLASAGQQRPRLASVPHSHVLPDAAPTPRPVDFSRVTTPEDVAAGDPDWIAGRLLADRAYFETKIGKLEALAEVTEANIAMMQIQFVDMQAKMKEVLDLVPTGREKKLMIAFIGIIMTILASRFGIDLGAFK